MKRWVSGAMAFIITFSCAQGGMALASGEVGEVIVEALMEEDAQAAFEEALDETIVAAEPVDASAVQAESDPAPVEYEETLGGDDAEAPEQVTEEAPETAEAPAPAVRYARIASETAEIRTSPEGAAIARLNAGSAVLVLEEGAAQWIGVAFNTERGIVSGCVEAGQVRLLDAEETAAYLDALAENETIAAYDGDINRPLERVECAFVEAEPEPVIEGEAEPVSANEPEAEAEAPAEAEPEAEGVEEIAEEPEPAEAPEEAPVADSEPADEPEDDAAQAEAEQGEGAEAEPETVVEANAEAGAVAGTQAAGETPAAAESAEPAATQEAAAWEAAEAAPTAEAAAIQVNASQLALGLKETYTGLSATGGSGGVTWSSSDAKIVAVDASTGAIKGVKKGSATVTATSGDGQTASVKVTVRSAPKKISFSSKKLTIGGVDKTVALKLKLSKGSASAGTVFSSSNAAVATVDAGGVVTAHSAGTAVITARTYNKKKATCKVTVYTEPMPAAIKLPSKVSMGAKETRTQLPVQLTPAAGDSQCTTDVVWSSSNKKIVKVDPKTGAIKALKKGTATIVAKTPNGLKAKCKVTVKKAPKKVALKPASSSVNVGGTVQFSVSLPKGTASGLTYASSNTAVATIDQNGLATGVAAGKTTITVTTYNGKKASATLEVSGGADSGTTDTSTKSEVSVPSSMEKLGIASYQNEFSRDMSNEQKLEYVIYCAQTQLGKPYVYGGGYSGANPSGFDCSGLVYWSFKQCGIKLEASAYKQGHDNSYTKITDIDSLKRGDVMCFYTGDGSGDINHTGIYLGNGYFIHASSGSSKRKVVVQRLYSDSISSDFYKRHFKWGRRILN